MNRFLTDDRTRLVYWGIPDPYTGKRNIFHLSGYGMGKEGVTLGVEPENLEFTDIDLLWSAGARQIGGTPTGVVIERRELQIEAQIYGKNKREYRRIRELWFKSWSPTQNGHLGVYTRYNGWRWLGVRLSGAPSPLWGKDPALVQAGNYSMDIVAPDPLWHTFKERYLWTNASDTGNGVIRLRNASEHFALPKFYMPGPGTYKIQDGDGGPMIELPKLVKGQTLSIDTHNLRPTARISSEDESKNLTVVSAMKAMKGKRFRNPLQPWTSTELKVSVSGGTKDSQIYAVSSPRFDSAW